jgi:short-subunit dehydrogenase
MKERPSTLITGASSGIGAALAWQAAADGHDLILTARRGYLLTELAEALTARHGGRILTLEADLSLPDGADRLVNDLLAQGWSVDFLVNNAGLGASGLLTDIPPARLTELLQVNLLSLTTLTRLLLPSMLAKGEGGILNVASLAAFQPGPLMAAYYASKAYVLSLTEALHAEVRRTGVRVSCLCPGATATGFAREAHMEDSRLFHAKLLDAETVARSAWRGFRRGRRVIIPGWKNKLLAAVARIAPHWISLPLIRLMHGQA